MTKEKLEFGNVVELNNGLLCLIEPINNYTPYFRDSVLDVTFATRLRDLKTAQYIADLKDYDDDLKISDGEDDEWDYCIVKVYKDYSLKKMLWERKEV